MTTTADNALWAVTIDRVRRELAALPESRRHWLTTQVTRIGVLQSELDRLFRSIDGPTICTDCLGGCCSRAKHHVTLSNVLAYLLAGEHPPEPDFSLPCPFLGAQGCRLPVARRPFNCTIFLCEAVDRQLSAEQRITFTGIEAELRTAYHEVAEQCPGASLRGLLIVAGRVGDLPLLTKPWNGDRMEWCPHSIRPISQGDSSMEINFTHTNGPLDELLDEILRLAEVHHPEMIREILINALRAGQEVDYLADLKMMRTTLREMRYTTRLFGTYRGRKKVTIFGSARTEPEEPIYQKCVTFSRQLNRLGYMVITGGGPGIMQAGNEGAGPDNSFAVNIRLPFEQETNPVMENSRNVISYKYFFNRKVAFLKEAHAVALFPGGFGTLDEAMETLTLVQTGKNPPIPLVLIDDDDGGYWEPWFAFIRDTLLKRGLISGEDFSLFTITRDPFEAAQVINDFYRVYHSSRFVGKTLVIRLNKPLYAEQIKTLQEEFAEIVAPGSHLAMTPPLPEERDQPDLLDLPRLRFEFNRRNYGLLEAFIRRLNSF